MRWVVVCSLLVAAGCADDSVGPLHDRAGARVDEVVDGDTFSVGGERVRIIGIDAPEARECLAGDAAERLRDLLRSGDVALVRDESDRDRFGRLLRYVEVNGRDVGEALVAEGLAIARRYPPDVARADRLERAQDGAQRRGAGIWAPDACGPAVDAGVELVTLNADPPGDDTLALDEEWVELANNGDEPVDLTGWRLRDESASNRFDFPDGFVLGPGERVRVRSGCGIGDGDLHWCSRGAAIWNNDGDTAFLLDPNGNVVDTLRYP